MNILHSFFHLSIALHLCKINSSLRINVNLFIAIFEGVNAFFSPKIRKLFNTQGAIFLSLKSIVGPTINFINVTYYFVREDISHHNYHSKQSM